jgi:hypothetical protein
MPDLQPFAAPLASYFFMFMTTAMLFALASRLVAWGAPLLAGFSVVWQLLENPAMPVEQIAVHVIVAGSLAALATAHALPLIAAAHDPE